MTTHTNGPLEAPGMDGDAFVVCTHKMVGKRRTVAHAYSAADAALFAAAPDLLAALREVIDGTAFYQARVTSKEWRAKARAALVKAEG